MNVRLIQSQWGIAIGAYERLLVRRPGGSEHPAAILSSWVRDIASARDKVPEHGENRRED
jgi:hypothetical protein